MAYTFTISVTTPNATMQYSIDNGVTWQSSTTFIVESIGIYTVKLKDSFDNIYTLGTVTLVESANELKFSSVTSTDCTEIGLNNGTITIVASGGVAPYQYSINNGVSYVSSGSFVGLSPANYVLRFKDANNLECGGVTINISEPLYKNIYVHQIITGSICINEIIRGTISTKILLKGTITI